MQLRHLFSIGLIGAGMFVLGGLLQEQRPATAQADVTTDGIRADRGESLTNREIRMILNRGEASANATLSGLRAVGGVPQSTRMHIAVVARDGRFLAIRSMRDAWNGSIDIAIGKARTAAFFSSNQNALTSRVIGRLSQAHDPDTGVGPAGPLWGIWVSNQTGISGDLRFRNGLIPFPGGVPLYKNGRLAGGVGVSGDGVDQDEQVAFASAAGFAPPANIAKLGFD